MKVRVLTSIGIAIVGIPILIFSGTIVFPIALALFAFIAAFELMRVIGVHKTWFISVPAYLLALALPFGTYFMKDAKQYLLLVALVFFVYLIYLFSVAVFMRGKLRFADMSEVFATLFYMIASFTALAILRTLPLGAWMLGFVFMGSWGCDVFAYFVGSLIGKHKLIPEISPKKTVEGSVGGIVFATLGFVLLGFIMSKTSEVNPNYIVIVIAGLLSSIVSQIGDLIASFIKREHGVKDYGKLLPGHGGIMDRFDSSLAVSTVLMIICLVYNPFI